MTWNLCKKSWDFNILKCPLWGDLRCPRSSSDIWNHGRWPGICAKIVFVSTHSDPGSRNLDAGGHIRWASCVSAFQVWAWDDGRQPRFSMLQKTLVFRSDVSQWVVSDDLRSTEESQGFRLNLGSKMMMEDDDEILLEKSQPWSCVQMISTWDEICPTLLGVDRCHWELEVGKMKDRWLFNCLLVLGLLS
jgi:hypothetical protein